MRMSPQIAVAKLNATRLIELSFLNASESGKYGDAMLRPIRWPYFLH